jgi:hypothetical protein
VYKLVWVYSNCIVLHNTPCHIWYISLTLYPGSHHASDTRPCFWWDSFVGSSETSPSCRHLAGLVALPSKQTWPWEIHGKSPIKMEVFMGKSSMIAMVIFDCRRYPLKSMKFLKKKHGKGIPEPPETPGRSQLKSRGLRRRRGGEKSLRRPSWN